MKRRRPPRVGNVIRELCRTPREGERIHVVNFDTPLGAVLGWNTGNC